MAGKTKIPITLVIEIDPQEWADEYGVAVSEVKEDITAYVTEYVSQMNGFVSTNAKVIIKETR